MALTVINASLDGKRINLRAEGATIQALGPDVAAQPGDDVIDAAGRAIVPGLVNGHTHAAMTLFRSYASDLQLQEWLEHYIWPAEARLAAEDVYWGTRLAAIEMVRNGTTRFFDMYWHPEAVARAAADTGIRATVGAPLFDKGAVAGIAGLKEAALESLAALAGRGPLITASLTPHSIYMVSEPSLAWVAEQARAHDVPVHLHFCETIREVDEWMATHDERPTPYLDRLGLLGPTTLLAHGCVMEPDDYALVAERGATIVTNPVSNLKLASGRIFPYAEAARHGVHLGLGTDGPSSNNSLDLFADLKVFALIQKHAAYDPTVLPAAEALAIAQGRRSPLLGGTPIEVGQPADFLLIDTDLPNLTPGDLTSNLVYSSNGSVVDSTVVAGTPVMRHRHIEGAEEALAEVRARAERLWAR
ncbi:MAG: amidohydrolase [Acidimicrobiales bacterium]|nr:amidohydrolase [Acidimicrobiales bacterium]